MTEHGLATVTDLYSQILAQASSFVCSRTSRSQPFCSDSAVVFDNLSSIAEEESDCLESFELTSVNTSKTVNMLKYAQEAIETWKEVIFEKPFFLSKLTHNLDIH